MTKQEKFKFVEELTEKIKQNPSFYVIDMGGFSVSKTNEFRAKAFAANLQVQVAKNTLIKKALDASEVDYSEIYPALKETSALVFFTENFKAPAQLIKDFRKEGEKPALKAAYVEETFFVGDAHLATLISLKNKNELIGDVIALLQSPAKNVVSALLSGKNTVAGLVKALEERKQ